MELGPHFFQQCQFEGCQSIVLSEGPYCMTHRSRASPPKAVATTRTSPVQNTPRPASQRSTSPDSRHASTKDSSRLKLGGAITVKPPFPAIAHTNTRKQLPDKHVARKTTKASHHQGPSHESISPSSNRTPTADVPLSSPRSVKKLKLPTESSRLDPAEDFALHPRKISLEESSEAKRRVDQGGILNRERPHKSPPPKPHAPNSDAGRTRFPGNPLVIDLTEDDVGTHPPPAQPRPANGHTIHYRNLNGYNNAPGNVPVSGLHEDKSRPEIRTNHRLRSPPLDHFVPLARKKAQGTPPADKQMPAVSSSNGLSNTESRPVESNGTYKDKKIQTPLLSPNCRQPVNGGHTFATFEKSITPPAVQSRAEERRQVLVAKHDPEKFDSYIYSELNRPNRPGDPLFYLPEYAQPSRPTRPATSFAYINPRIYWTHAHSKQWHRDKKDEIAARGTRKKNFGKAAERMASHKQQQIVNGDVPKIGLPERVRTNLKWLAALDELDEMAAEYHEQKRAVFRRKNKGKENAKADDDAMDVDKDMDADLG
ncbi:hypothetical protein F5X99DRAFT_262178 [Biscogniauxia marginata]|nr:hypothetical protein F5X99DRAFT_262178 [Biscogniauxia marginata]